MADASVLREDVAPTRATQAGLAGYRPQIDGVRAIAVVAVVLFHLGFHWIPGGFVGVDVFFVLSGYLISELLINEARKRGTVSLSRFYARRARRLLPAAWVVVLFAVIVGRNVSSPIEYENMRRHAMSAVLYVANWDWINVDHGYFATDTKPSPLIHFWTLAVEEQFYFVWPALVVGCLWLARRTNRSVLAVAAVAFGVITVVSIGLAVTLTPSQAAYYGTHTRAFELSAGGLLAVVMRGRQLRSSAEPDKAFVPHWHGDAAALLAGVGLAGLVLLMLTVTGSTSYPGWAAVGVTAAAVLLIAGVDLGDTTVPARVFGSPVPVWLGKLSYSIYLWHWPLIVFFKGQLGILALTGLILLASLLSYVIVEQPIRRRLFPGVAFWKVPLVGLATSTVVGLVVIPSLLHNNWLELQAVAARHDVAQPPGTCPYRYGDWPSPAASDACLLNNGTGPTVLLVGDSHAQMWAPALQALAPVENWHLLSLTRARCPPTDFTVAPRRMDTPGQPTIGEDCTRWRHVTYPKMVRRYDPDYVILAGRSQVHQMEVGNRIVRGGHPGYNRLWRRSWHQPINTFTARGAQLFVLAPMPTLPTSVEECVATQTQCVYKASADPETTRARPVMIDLAKRYPDVHFVDVLRLVCPGGMCLGRIDGLVVHQDRSHVTATFAAHEAEQFGRLLAQAGLPVPS